MLNHYELTKALEHTGEQTKKMIADNPVYGEPVNLVAPQPQRAPAGQGQAPGAGGRPA
jgi:hypothetical protein